MPTFVLTKYKEQEKPAEQPAASVSRTEEDVLKRIKIDASETVAEVVAKALYAKFGNTVDIQKSQSETESSIKAITTEDINSKPIDVFEFSKRAETLLIVGEGFKTSKEEWFLSNMENRQVRSYYSLNGFMTHIATELLK